ncbi:MAG: nucleotidyltransferase domain-containing protein [Candidatus Nanoarchaeia archaeon]|nr:nucleotidyltransferase domain-containing protein [Candidatus Nanoarchaeia archaeon]
MTSKNSGRNSAGQWGSLASYASSFASFVIGHADLSKLKNIILFGSAARGDAGDDSDIDIFIDGALSQKEVDKILLQFSRTDAFKKWGLLGISNEIKPIAGNLDEWSDLKQSIIADGIVLYGNFKEMPENAKPMALFSWEEIKPNSNRVLFNKRMFGFLHYGKRYEGLLETIDGKKIGKGAVFVPDEKHKEVLELFKRHDVKFSMKKVLEVGD